MPTPKAGYYTRDGTRVPGVTTILGRFKDAGGLIHWSWNIAHDPLLRARALVEQLVHSDGAADLARLDVIVRSAEAFLALPIETFDYRAARDKAADAGTIAHAMVEAFIRERPFDPALYPPALVRLAEPAFTAFREWAASTRLETIETEVPLVSEAYRFGGTRDAILVNGKRALGDWKSSNAIYPEYLCQLAAYGILDEEQGKAIDGGFHLLRFSKQASPDEPIHFVHHYWSQLDAAGEAFLLMRRLYDLMGALKRLAA